MLNTIFSSVFTETTAAFTFGQFLACTAVSLILGLLIAAVYRYKSECTKSFAVTLVLMPVIVQPLPEPSLSSDSVLHREVPKKSAASFLLWQLALQPVWAFLEPQQHLQLL